MGATPVMPRLISEGFSISDWSSISPFWNARSYAAHRPTGTTLDQLISLEC